MVAFMPKGMLSNTESSRKQICFLIMVKIFIVFCYHVTIYPSQSS